MGDLASMITLVLRLIVILTMMSIPVRASDFSTTGEKIDGQTLLHQVAVFSDDPNSIHDPRHPQSQTGADKMFAPIGIIWTNNRQPDQGTVPRSDFHMGTAFLVSPCYVLTAYHVVFGYRFGLRRAAEQAERDVSATFKVGGNTSLAVPARYGQFSRFPSRDWVLLRLKPAGGHKCLGEDPNIGWLQLAPLEPAAAAKKTLSVAGYPSDKSLASLWRQDKCHFFEQSRDIDNDGLWTTDCETRPRGSGSPVFFVQDGVLNVVAIMHGHLGTVGDDEILPKWDPNRANLALDLGNVISSDPNFLTLVKADIDRFHRPNPARVLIEHQRRH